MKLSLTLTTLATVLLTSISGPSIAQTAFGEKEVDQNQFIAVARPFGQNNYDLLVIEQIPGKKKCWSENGSNPTLVDPLLLNFDFTGHCSRSTDANGYSMRIDGKDYGLEYLLRIISSNNELLLVATPRADRSQPDIIIAETNGASRGFLKFYLKPGWKFAKRTFQNKTLGHVYFSGDQAVIDGKVPVASASAFTDISNDIYKDDIEKAVKMGFIAGFNDNTFRPLTPLTREQLVSIVIEALKTIRRLNIQVPSQISSSPYPDVASNRWSAAKIKWAKDNNIVSGYPNGTFDPTKPVTRAELIAVLRKAAIFALEKENKLADLKPQGNPKNFSDISGHWAESQITQMSAYCSVASPVNETGTNFSPNSPSLRNYAAAATLRMITCVKKEIRQD